MQEVEPIIQPLIDATDIVAVVGLVIGVAGFALGVVNYLQDRAKVVVDLRFDFRYQGPPRPDIGARPDRLYALVSVVNLGRRPIFVSHAGLVPARTKGPPSLVLGSGVSGKKLSEGDDRWVVHAEQTDAFYDFAKRYPRMRAVVTGASGKLYFSRTRVAPTGPSEGRQVA